VQYSIRRLVLIWQYAKVLTGAAVDLSASGHLIEQEFGVPIKGSDSSDSPCFRLARRFRSADLNGMNNYSADTRVELTAKGWLFGAQSALDASEQCSDQNRSAEFEHIARNRIRIALATLQQPAASSSNQIDSIQLEHPTHNRPQE
jgi:hypothetical protein